MYHPDHLREIQSIASDLVRRQGRTLGKLRQGGASREPTKWNKYFGRMRKRHPEWSLKRIGVEYRARKKRGLGQAYVSVGGKGATRWNKYFAKMRKRYPRWSNKRIAVEYRRHVSGGSDDKEEALELLSDIKKISGAAQSVPTAPEIVEYVRQVKRDYPAISTKMAMSAAGYQMPSRPTVLPLPATVGGASRRRKRQPKKRKPNRWLLFLKKIRKSHPGINMTNAAKIYKQMKAKRGIA